MIDSELEKLPCTFDAEGSLPRIYSCRVPDYDVGGATPEALQQAMIHSRYMLANQNYMGEEVPLQIVSISRSSQSSI
jgi:hypothetical protein